MTLRILVAMLLTLSLVGCNGDPAEPAAIAPPEETEGSEANAGEDADPGSGTEEAEAADDIEDPAPGEEDSEAAEISVRIYFPSNRGDGLIAESRKILPSANVEDRIKQILGHLLDGPAGSRVTAAVPKGTTLRQAYLASNGTAYVDLSSQLQRGLNGGSMQETLTVYAVVNSVALNLREVRSVGILVNGQPVDSLNGHLDLRYPLRSNRDLLLR